MFSSAGGRLVASLAARRGRPAPWSSPAAAVVRTYLSRAHPRPVPEIPLIDAVESLLKEADQRNRRRQRKVMRNESKFANKSEGTASGPTDGPPSGGSPPPAPTGRGSAVVDETVELAVNLNLDPRKPGQALRGSVQLPFGTGRSLACVVFTRDEALAAAARAAGAAAAGGEALVEEVVGGTVPVDGFQRALATTDMAAALGQRAARLLGPRGLMPNAKSHTLFPSGDELLAALEAQLAGKEAQYRTDKEGIVHVPVGKASFGLEKLLQNIGQVMKELVVVKPEQYGKGKKSGKATGKSAKYFLRASVSTTQGKGVRLDLRTVDPSSPFFLKSTEDSGPAEQAA